APGTMVRLAVQRDDRALIDKKLAVLGNRYWVGNKATDPAPFQSMPIDFAHAFGGEGYALNPAGKGAVALATEHGEVVPLPNVEDPKHLVVSPRDRPLPATLGPLDVTLPQRLERMGKRYDAAWLKTRFPGPAEDFDGHFYNVALPD